MQIIIAIAIILGCLPILKAYRHFLLGIAGAVALGFVHRAADISNNQIVYIGTEIIALYLISFTIYQIEGKLNIREAISVGIGVATISLYHVLMVHFKTEFNFAIEMHDLKEALALSLGIFVYASPVTMIIYAFVFNKKWLIAVAVAYNILFHYISMNYTPFDISYAIEIMSVLGIVLIAVFTKYVSRLD